MGGLEPEFLRPENVTARFKAIFDSTDHPLSRRHRQLGVPLYRSRKTKRRLKRTARQLINRFKE